MIELATVLFVRSGEAFVRCGALGGQHYRDLATQAQVLRAIDSPMPLAPSRPMISYVPRRVAGERHGGEFSLADVVTPGLLALGLVQCLARSHCVLGPIMKPTYFELRRVSSLAGQNRGDPGVGRLLPGDPVSPASPGPSRSIGPLASGRIDGLQEHRRDELHDPIHPAQVEQHVEQHQHQARSSADRTGPDATRRLEGV
jgi:hypothetical protein